MLLKQKAPLITILQITVSRNMIPLIEKIEMIVDYNTISAGGILGEMQRILHLLLIPMFWNCINHFKLQMLTPYQKDLSMKMVVA